MNMPIGDQTAELKLFNYNNVLGSQMTPIFHSTSTQLISSNKSYHHLHDTSLKFKVGKKWLHKCKVSD